MKILAVISSVLVLLLFVGSMSIAPAFLPTDDELMPPVANSEIRNRVQSYKNRPDIIAKYIKIYLKDSARSETEKWWGEYVLAQAIENENSEKSCELYMELAAEPKFPLNQLAKIHAENKCGTQITQVESKSTELKDSALDAELELALKDNDHIKAVELLVQKSKSSLIYSEKVDLMLQAQEIAKKHKLDSLTAVNTRLYRISPSRHPKPPRQSYLDVAYDLSKRRLFKQARVYYRKITRSSRFSMQDRIKAYKGLRQSYKLQLDRDNALKATADLENYVYQAFKKHGLSRNECKTYSDVNILLARHQWTDHKDDLAQKTLKKLLRNCETKLPLPVAHWTLGRMEEERQNFVAAAEQFTKAKKTVGKKSELYQRILWNLAWVNYKMGKFQDSAEDLQTLANENVDGLTGEKYAFWLAMSLRKQNEIEQSQKVFEKLIDETPLSFYSYLAQRELGHKLEKTEVLEHLSEQAQKEPRPLHIYFDNVYFQWLVATNETDVAKNYLSTVSTNLRASNDKDNLESWVFILNQYTKLNSHNSVFEKIAVLEDGLRKEIFHNYRQLIFPMPFNDEVLSSSARFGVRPEYIYAIMRQESAFNPKARSPMDAFGLMQMIPEVAVETAKKTGVDFKDATDLYNPETSITLGASHLKELLERHNGNLVLAIASYNANERAIQNWMDTRFRGDTLEFIEDIPYQETSNYVKLVLRNLYTYSLLRSEETQTQFPEWTLTMHQNSDGIKEN